MFGIKTGDLFEARTLQIHPAWFLIPIGLVGCLLIGLYQGFFQSPTLAGLALGAGLALLWLAVVVIRPQWALLFYVFVGVNLNGIDLPMSFGGFRLSPDIVLVSVLIVGTVLRLLHERRRLDALPVTAPYLVFLAVPIITLIWSPVKVESIRGIFRFVGYYALMWLAVEVVRTRRAVLQMVGAFILSPVIPIVVAVYQAMTGSGQRIYAGELFNRVYGLTGGPFALAFYLVLIIPWLVVFMIAGWREKRAERSAAGQSLSQHAEEPERLPGVLRSTTLLSLILAGALVALVLTYIRGSWLALAVALILLGIVYARGLLLTFPGAAAGLFLAYGPAQYRILQTFDVDSTLFGRLRLWRFSLEWVASSPLVGLGMKAFEYFYILRPSPFSGFMLPNRERFLFGARPHNEIIGFLLDVGLVGTVAMIIVLVMIVRTAFRIRREGSDEMRLVALAFLVSAAGMLVGTIGDNVFSQPAVAAYFWLMAGLILAIDRRLMAVAGSSAGGYDEPLQPGRLERSRP